MSILSPNKSPKTHSSPSSEEDELSCDPTGNCIVSPTYVQKFLAKRKESLHRLREEVTCAYQSPARAFQHRLLLNNLNVELLEQDLGSFIMFDHILHEELGCLIDALVHRYTDEPLHDRIRTTITTPTVIGQGKSSIFTSGLQGSNDLFVVKTSVVSNFECLYEYIVGKLIINPLRAELPNFMYTYGYHECGNYATKDGKMIKWCNTDIPDMGYLYLEKIDGIRMDDFLDQYGEDSPEFVEVMLQIINALYIADERYSFRHGGLHQQNIIIRELSEPINVPFTVLGRREYIQSQWIPQIIDFGDSTAVYNGTRLISPIYFSMRGKSSNIFPYDLGYLLNSAAFSLRWNGSKRIRELSQRLYLDGRKDPNLTFYHIALTFIEIFGDEPIYSEDQVAQSSGRRTLSLPSTIIGNSNGFYQRYFITRSYHPAEYYDLVNLINKYHLSDLREWIQNSTVTKIDVMESSKSILEQVESLVTNNPVRGLLRKDERGIDITLYERLDIINQIADYTYVLRSYCHLVLPVMRARRLVSARDEAYVRKVTQAISDKYEALVKEAHRLYSATERAFLTEGYSRDYYEQDMGDLATKIALLPRIEEM